MKFVGGLGSRGDVMSKSNINDAMSSEKFAALVEEIKQRDSHRKQSRRGQQQSYSRSRKDHSFIKADNAIDPQDLERIEDRDQTLKDYVLEERAGVSQEDLTAQLLAAAKREEEQAREWRYWRERAMNFLIRREHSEVELRQKLQQRQCPSALIDPIIDWLYGERYLSLERFAYSYSKNRADLGYGPIRVRYELAQIHRISERDIKAAFKAIDWHHARLIAERKVGKKEGAKYYAALYRRGFSGEMIVEDDL